MTGPRSVLVENGAGKIRARRNLFHSVKYLNEESKFRLGGGEGEGEGGGREEVGILCDSQTSESTA